MAMLDYTLECEDCKKVLGHGSIDESRYERRTRGRCTDCAAKQPRPMLSNAPRIPKPIQDIVDKAKANGAVTPDDLEALVRALMGSQKP